MRTRNVLYLLVVLALLCSMSSAVGAAPAQTPCSRRPISGIFGPFTGEMTYPTVWNGDLRVCRRSARRTQWAATHRTTCRLA